MGNRSAWKFVITFLLIATATATAPCNVQEVAAQDPPATEYRIKAVFLYHFTQFVEWPQESFDGTAAPLVIGVLGDDPGKDAYVEYVIAHRRQQLVGTLRCAGKQHRYMHP